MRHYSPFPGHPDAKSRPATVPAGSPTRRLLD
jgi:hypothetical protein